MKCEFKRMRIEIACLRAVRDSTVELPRCGKRAARVTMPCGPMRPARQHPFVGCCRLLVFPAIAEDPSAQVNDFLFFRLQFKGTAGALDCNLATALMVQRLAQLTVDRGSLVIGHIPTLEIKTACLQVARRGGADRRLTNFTKIAQLGSTLGALKGQISRCERWRRAAVGGITALAARPWQSPPRSDLRRMFGRTHICLNTLKRLKMRFDLSEQSQKVVRKLSVVCTLEEFFLFY